MKRNIILAIVLISIVTLWGILQNQQDTEGQLTSSTAVIGVTETTEHTSAPIDL